MADLSSLKILIAEDNKVNQRVLLLMLKRLGVAASLVADGKAAVEFVHANAPDVILMDLQMPEMDGLQATQVIRKEAPAQQQPYIIAVTAHALERDVERCMQAGMQAHLAKPLRTEQLEQALRELMMKDWRPALQQSAMR
jgi:CheY-like chemotaxis protein